MAKFLDKIAYQIQTNPKNSLSIEQNISRAINQGQNIIKNIETSLSQINFNHPNLKNVKPLSTQLGQMLLDIKAELNSLKSNINNPALDIKEFKLSNNIAASANRLSAMLESTQLSQINSATIAQTAQSTPNLESLISGLNQSQNSTNLSNFIQHINTDANNLNLQDKLSMAARKLSNIINFFDKNSQDAKSHLAELKGLIKATNLAKADIANITPNDKNLAAQTLQNDVKATLLALKEATANQPNQAALNQNINRLLTQIEMHQLISYAQNSLQTYLPYSWDALESSSVAFKQGKKKRFYAKIDLNFTHFGNVDIVIALSDNKYIDISIATGTAEFKNLILSASKELKSAITGLGLIVSSFTLAHKPKKAPYHQADRAFDFGFNKKA